ncbi:MAG: hypothetical protein ACRC62_23745 [Microcoleus sp.]
MNRAIFIIKRRKARHGFGHGYTDELFTIPQSLEGRGKREAGGSK